MRELEGQTINLSKLFTSEFFFKIPDYQRPFSWDEDNFSDLITDTLEAEREQQYFLGTIVLHQDKVKKIHSVVDGQQRLTSLMILLACLRDMISDPRIKGEIQEKIMQNANEIDEIPERPRLEVKDYSIFKSLVLTEKGTESKTNIKLNEPEIRYLKAIRVFRDKLEKLNQDELKSYVKFLNKQCVLIYLSTSTFDDAFRLFTIVNDRGKQLRRIDILKAENISPDVVASEATRQKVASLWETLELEVGEDRFESILHLVRLIYIKEKPQADLLKEFDQKIFKKKLISKGEDFVNKIATYVKIYQQLFINFDVLGEGDPNFEKYAGLAYVMDQEFAASEWRACVLMFAEKFKSKLIFEFLQKIEKMYLELWISGVRKDERIGKYIQLLASIDESSRPEDVIKFIKYDEMQIKKAVLNSNIYEKGYAKYLLSRLELLASDFDKPVRIDAKSIEHVFPVNPDPKSRWMTDPRISEKDQFINTIGNLVLLSRSKNSSAGNLEFDDKKRKYLTPRVSSYPRSVQLLAEPSWSIDVINKRNIWISENILNDI